MKAVSIRALVFFLASINIGLSQNQKLGVILDSATQRPIQFVDVFNGYDNTFTNTEGAYIEKKAKGNKEFKVSTNLIR